MGVTGVLLVLPDVVIGCSMLGNGAGAPRLGPPASRRTVFHCDSSVLFVASAGRTIASSSRTACFPAASWSLMPLVAPLLVSLLLSDAVTALCNPPMAPCRSARNVDLSPFWMNTCEYGSAACAIVCAMVMSVSALVLVGGNVNADRRFGVIGSFASAMVAM